MPRHFIIAVVAVILAATASPATAFPRHERASAGVLASTAIPDDTEVYLVGDSITTMPDSWAYRWQQRICGTETTCLSNVHIGVAGGTGGCLTGPCSGHPPLVEEWDTAVLQADPKPTTVVVEIGTNDFFVPGVTVYTMAAAYQHLMFSGIDAGIRVILATIPPTTTWWPWHDAHNPLRQSINSWLVNYFGDSNIFNIDSGLKIYGTADADPYYYILSGGDPSKYDGLHPTPWGMVCIADWLDPARIV